MEGTIVRIPKDKLFGFIREQDTGTEYFFHKSEFNGHWDDLIMDIRTGEKIKVKFEEGPAKNKGPRAANISRLDWPNQST